MERRGSMVACATCKREIAGSIAGWAQFAVTLCSWARSLPARAPSRPRSKCGYLVRPRRPVLAIRLCASKVVAARLYMPPGELRWLNMNEQGPVTRRKLCKARRAVLALDIRL